MLLWELQKFVNRLNLFLIVLMLRWTEKKNIFEDSDIWFQALQIHELSKPPEYILGSVN